MERSADFGPMIQLDTAAFKPTPTSNGEIYPVKLPNSIEEAERLLTLLENMLDTNGKVLHLLGIDLPPITNQHSNPGAVILHQYKQRLAESKDYQRRYGQKGYVDESEALQLLDNRAWLLAGVSHKPDIQTLSSELIHLTRLSRSLKPE